MLNEMVKYSAGTLDATLSALSDPIRRGIVERLASGEASVGELAAPYEVSLPAISRHLKVLEHAGLLEREKRGREHRCRLRAEPLGDVADWVERCRDFWERRLDRLEEVLTDEG